MKRILVALVAVVLTIQMAFVPAEAGALRKLEAIYTATKIVKTASAARKRATLVRKYIKEMEAVSGQKISVKQFSQVKKCLQSAETCLKKVPKSEWANKGKRQAISEWVANEKRAWPTYAKNVISKVSGRPFRAAGEKLDAHHIIPQKYGGPNKGYNIIPMPQPQHQAIIHGR